MITLLLLAGVCVAVMMPPAYIVFYLRTHVPKRRKELEKVLGPKQKERAKQSADPDDPERQNKREKVIERKQKERAEQLAGLYEEIFAPGRRKGQSGTASLLNHFDDCHSAGRYWFAGTLVWLPTTIGMILVTVWCSDRLDAETGTSAQVPLAIVLAFLGGYVWSFYDLLSSGYRGDLAPGRLFSMAFRIVISVPIGYAFSLLVLEGAGGFAAFVASAFPLRDLRLLARQWFLRVYAGESAGRASAREDSLRDRVQGLSTDTLARLQEIRINTVLDMAYADPLALVAQTGFALRHVVDWVDQSLLALYAGEKMPLLPSLGIRSALEASHFYNTHCVHDPEEKEKKPRKGFERDPLVRELAKVMGRSPGALANMLGEIDGDPHVELLSLLWGEDDDEDEDEDEDEE